MSSICVDLPTHPFLGWRQPHLFVECAGDDSDDYWTIYEGFPISVRKEKMLFEIDSYVGKIAFGTRLQIQRAYESFTDDQIIQSFAKYAPLLEFLAEKIVTGPDQFVAEIRAAFAGWNRLGISAGEPQGIGYSVQRGLMHLLKTSAASWASWPTGIAEKLAPILDPAKLVVAYAEENRLVEHESCVKLDGNIRDFVERRPAWADSIVLITLDERAVLQEHASVKVFPNGRAEASQSVETAIYCIESTLISLENMRTSLIQPERLDALGDAEILSMAP